jgi:hypothetical protein
MTLAAQDPFEGGEQQRLVVEQQHEAGRAGLARGRGPRAGGVASHGRRIGPGSGTLDLLRARCRRPAHP